MREPAIWDFHGHLISYPRLAGWARLLAGSKKRRSRIRGEEFLSAAIAEKSFKIIPVSATLSLPREYVFYAPAIYLTFYRPLRLTDVDEITAITGWKLANWDTEDARIQGAKLVERDKCLRNADRRRANLRESREIFIATSLSSRTRRGRRERLCWTGTITYEQAWQMARRAYFSSCALVRDVPPRLLS